MYVTITCREKQKILLFEYTNLLRFSGINEILFGKKKQMEMWQ
jgi:hypothetical protein